MREFERFLTKPHLRVYSGLAINISAALLVAPFVGYTISLPKTAWELAILIVDFGTAIMFLLFAIWCEKKLDRRK